MRRAFSGVSAAAVLVAAVAAGMVGGALAMTSAQPDPAAPPAVTTLHQVAEELDIPTPTPSAAPEVDEKQVVSAPVVHSGSSATDRAEHAAEQAALDAAAAKAAAKRAADAADRAEEKKASEPAPKPTVEPVPAVFDPGPAQDPCEAPWAGPRPASCSPQVAPPVAGNG